MSVEAITWALRQPIPHSSAKFVLVVLANCANVEQAQAWPSVAYLAASTGQDRKTVTTNLQRLQEWGLIEDTGRRVGTTKQIVVYRLICSGDLFAKGAEKRNSSENGTVPEKAPKSTVFPGKTPENGTRNRKEAKGNVTDAHRSALRFDEWWQVYPKQVSRKRCLDHWGAKGLDAKADELIADVVKRKAECARWKGGYAPDPLTYLEDERWTDQVHVAPAPPAATPAPVGAASRGTAPARDIHANPESPLAHALAHIRNQHAFGAYGEGAAADAERDRLMVEARVRHGSKEAEAA